MKFVICFAATLALVSAASLPDIGLPRLDDTRIVGGESVNIAQYPHQVSLRYKGILTPENPYSHWCGASIIAEKVFLTAAHCIIAKVPSQFQVVVGSSNRRGNDGTILPVKQIIMHEDYNPSNYNNDIALLVVEALVPLNSYNIKAIPLAEQAPAEGAMATITGWGALVQGGGSPLDLQAVHIPIVGNEACSEDYAKVNAKITDAMICAGYRGVGGKDSCQGDSGGPLVVNGKLAGVVSWGYGCAQPAYPGVYASVSHLLPWIKEKLAQIENNSI